MSTVFELAGFACFVAGVYLLTSLGWALIAAATVCVFVGWAMDAGEKSAEPSAPARPRVREPREPTTNRMIEEQERTAEFDVAS